MDEVEAYLSERRNSSPECSTTVRDVMELATLSSL